MDHTEKIIKKILEHADKTEETAAYNGANNDWGAELYRMQVKFFQYGQNGTMPPEWKKILYEGVKPWQKKNTTH